ncbi:MAG TPA: hypothetical protein VLL05_04830 [Terriglobales bacterium]|nr:hypothetical protein [Terriglobales bacterium]
MPKSAVDVISTAFAHTADQLAEPFRFGQWARLAVLALATGELSSGSGCGNVFRSFPTQFPKPSHNFMDPKDALSGLGIDPALIATLLLILIGGGLILMLVWIYVASVSRFMLFEAVLRKNCDSLSASWQRWQGTGLRYFGWQLALSFISLMVAAVLFIPLLIPLLATMRNHQTPGPEVLLAFLPMIFVFGVFSLVVVLVSVLSKDFVVPLMAIDGVGFLEGWRRLAGMIKSELLSYAGYIGMKIVLAIGASVVFGILSAIAAVFVMLPVAVVGVIVAIMVKGGGLSWNAVTITAAVVAGVIVFAVLTYVVAFACVPAAVFFPAYAMYFFAERFPALHARLYPTAPPAPNPSWTPAPVV